MNIITEEMFRTIEPSSSINYYDSLLEVQKEEYLRLYSLYNHLLMKYIMKNFGLQRYDDVFNHNHNFFKVPKEKMDIYQFRAYGFLNFYYLRNNIYIERLSEKEKKFLFDKLKRLDYELDSASESFIQGTFYKVLLESSLQSYTIYGLNNDNFMRPSNALIFGIRNDDYCLDGKSFDWEKMNSERKSVLFFFNQALEQEFSTKLGVPVFVIQYNDFSVNKKYDDSFVRDN